MNLVNLGVQHLRRQSYAEAQDELTRARREDEALLAAAPISRRLFAPSRNSF